MNTIKFCDKCKREINAVNFSRHICATIDEIEIIKKMYNDGISLQQIKSKHSAKAIRLALRGCRRSMSEAVKLVRNQYPNSFSHELSNETKQKIRQAHLNKNGFNKVTDQDIERIRKLYDDGLSLRKLLKIENKWAVRFALQDRKRTKSDQSKLAHKLYPESYKLTDKAKQNISAAMKLAHKERRAWNIGKSRWNNEQSFPEKFFEKVINNEFNDKNYETEYPIEIYSFDFAWPLKKKAIEIDGQQHQRFEEYKLRDEKKNEIAKQQGWTILRLVWREVFKNPKHWIKIANEFVGL